MLRGSLHGPLCFVPPSFASLGRQAGQRGDIKELQRKQFFPEGATMPQRNNSSDPPECSEPSLPCQASDHPSLPAARGALPPQMERAAQSASRHSSPARLCRHPRTVAPGPEQPPRPHREGLRGTNYFQMPGSEAQGKREAQVCTWVCSQHKERSSST